MDIKESQKIVQITLIVRQQEAQLMITPLQIIDHSTLSVLLIAKDMKDL